MFTCCVKKTKSEYAEISKLQLMFKGRKKERKNQNEYPEICKKYTKEKRKTLIHSQLIEGNRKWSNEGVPYINEIVIYLFFGFLQTKSYNFYYRIGIMIAIKKIDAVMILMMMIDD